MLRKLWNGEIPLVKTFWLYGILVYAVSVVAVGFIMFISKDMKDPIPALPIVLSLISSGMLKVYYFIQTVGVWKSTTNYHGPKIWKILARIWVPFWLFGLIIDIAEYIEILTYFCSR